MENVQPGCSNCSLLIYLLLIIKLAASAGFYEYIIVIFHCLLNDPMHFRGGGLYIKDIDQSIQLNKGEAVAHAGKWLHAGLPITSGRRVVLVGFIGYNLIDHEALGDIS